MPRKTRRRSRKNSQSGGRRRRRSSRRSRRRRKGSRKGKRKMNGFFKLMLNAKRKKLSEFRYKGKRYVAKKTKTGMTVFKKA